MDIEKVSENFSYYTYEKTFNFGDSAVAGVLGGWDSRDDHRNYGSRAYSSADAFIVDVLGSEKKSFITLKGN